MRWGWERGKGTQKKQMMMTVQLFFSELFIVLFRTVYCSFQKPTERRQVPTGGGGGEEEEEEEEEEEVECRRFASISDTSIEYIYLYIYLSIYLSIYLYILHIYTYYMYLCMYVYIYIICMSLLASTHPVTPPSLCVRGTCHVIVCHVIVCHVIVCHIIVRDVTKPMYRLCVSQASAVCVHTQTQASGSACFRWNAP